MSAEVYPYDPRFPVPDSMTTDDPNHPANITKRSIQLQNQAVSDTKYDLPLPKRFKGRESFQTVSEKTGSSRTRSSQTESFKNPFQGPADWIMAVGLLVFLVIIYFYTKDTMRTMYILVLTIVVALLFMIYKKALLDYE